MNHRAARRGFTLIELLVVISILMILSLLVFAAFTGRTSDKARSGARLAQSAFLGAKDRALHAKELRGVRLTRDATDNSLVNGFVYLQPMQMQTYQPGSFKLDRLDMDKNNIPDSADILIVRGNSAGTPPSVDWDAKTQFFANPGRIRIPMTTGQWYTFTWSTTGTYPLSASNEVLQLTTPFTQQPTDPLYAYPASMTAYPASVTSFTSCDIQLGNDVLPFHQPISLPSGIVIDLNYSYQGSNANSIFATVGGTASIDIMFSPRGGVSGYLSALGPLYFLIRDIRDATTGINPFNVTQSQTARGDVLVLTLFPQTGLVQTFEIDPTDADGNGTMDNPFNFAKQGRSAGR